ncbi:MAG: 3-isopropylmalate dehydratase [Rhodospirillales bacterium]|nr:3-isopropylmalate dehydratase [Rhodospirillales bacterium]
MNLTVQGKTWKFAEDINTDFMSPSFTKNMGWDEVKGHILHVHKGFTAGFQPGDVIVAGPNFGCGSSRQTAPENLKKLGVGCVVAESFGRIFFRNSIAIALPVLACPGITENFEEGDQLEVNFDRSTVKNLTQGTDIQAPPLSEELVRILAAGGAQQLLREEAEGRAKDGS